MPALAEAMLGGAPAWLWDVAEGRVLLASASGVEFFGAPGLAALAARTFDMRRPAMMQLARLADQLPVDGAPQLAMLRFFVGLRDVSVAGLCRLVDPDERRLVLVVAAGGGADRRPVAERAALAFDGLDLPVVITGPGGEIFRTPDAASVDVDALPTDAARPVRVDGLPTPLTLFIRPADTGADAPRGDVSAPAGAPTATTAPAAAPVAATAPGAAAPASADRPMAQVATRAASAPAGPSLPRRLPETRRFTFMLDAEGRFAEVGAGFAGIVGASAADVVGKPWRELAATLGLDPDGRIAAALSSRDTWSDMQVDWPTDFGDRARLRLSALPRFGEGRAFVGFRGFADALDLLPSVPDPVPAVGLVSQAPDTQAPDPNEVEDEATVEPAAASGAGTAEREPEPAAAGPEGPDAEGPDSDIPDDAGDGIGALDVMFSEEDVDTPADRGEGLSDEPGTQDIEPGTDAVAGDPRVVRIGPVTLPAGEYGGLSDRERSAFQAIARALGGRVPDDDDVADEGVEVPGEAPEEVPLEASAEAPGSDGEDGAAAPTADTPEAGSAEPVDAPAPYAPDDSEPEDEAGDAPVVQAGDSADNAPSGPAAGDDAGIEASPDDDLDDVYLADEAGETDGPATGATTAATAVDQDAPPAETAPAPPTADEALPAPASPGPALPGPASPGVEALVAAIFERVPVALAILRGGSILSANKAFLALFGYADPVDLERSGGLGALLEGRPPTEHGEPAPVVARRADGSPIEVDVRLARTPWIDGPAMLISVRPAAEAGTDDEAAEAVSTPGPVEREPAAEAELAELRGVVEMAADGVVILTGDGAIASVNPGAGRLLSGAGGDLLGRALVDCVAPARRSAVVDLLEGARACGLASVLAEGREVALLGPEGRDVPVQLTIGRLSGEGQQRFCAVLRDLSKWKDAEAALVEARKRAEDASAQKSDLLAKISHEIRTPLNGIIGFSEVMSEERFGPLGSERYREYVKDIRDSGEHIMSLVNDLLDLSKVEAGKMELAFTEVRLNDLIEQSVAITGPQAGRSQVIIRTSLASGLPEVVADTRSIRQVLLNLLSNAIKFTGPGGQVIVSTARGESGDVVVRVRDTGIGMSESDVAAAMEPFRQLSVSPGGRDRGTGLGLPLSKALTEANRATFSLQSRVGEGTLVEIGFPQNRVLSE